MSDTPDTSPKPYKPPFDFSLAVHADQHGLVVIAEGASGDMHGNTPNYIETKADLEAFIAHIRAEAAKAGLM